MSFEIRNDLEVNVSKHEYIHFETIHTREIYMKNNKHLKISHLCCGGKGIAVEKGIPVIKPVVQTVVGTCDICFQDKVELHKTCNTCTQPFCRSCLDKLPSKICPYCRGILCTL